jgi:hypothetical protein
VPVAGGGGGEGGGPEHGSSRAHADRPAGDGGWPRWRFFAVSYDADSANVRWYFGTSRDAATLDTGAQNGQYSRGAVEDPQLPLAFGNFGSGFRKNDRL